MNEKLKLKFITFLKVATLKEKTNLSKSEWLSEIGAYFGLTSETSARYNFNLLVHNKYLIPKAKGFTINRKQVRG